ncbi:MULTISPECIES: NAD(P)-dependent oxidoreductase [Niveibacterium]|uniref:NAD(P)-dependent oxidoreductase n=1 Tax=Niveibacterium microcysteis TaxID=2811415 RepID=A0ABX7M4A7_9RHOO|nr:MULTISPECIES: NAD(P)-dependent oxidoreductase [Niveibacterium]QSI76023.1 NAD(P)-dependent oxidoreductase [Niveibacterium microcysteis]
MRVGFVGLGIMGRPMALNLLKGGHEVAVWTRRAESMQPLLIAGAKPAESPAALARDCDVVISMVADAPDVEEVALGARGVAEGAEAANRVDLVFIDMSTIAPSAARSIAARMAERGVTMLDAPVSGGEVGAIAGSLTIMVGGHQAAFERARPVLEGMGKTVTWIGESGAGQVAKACNQILTGAGVAIVAEALHFARASGVDPARVREAMLGGFAYSRILENHGQRMLDRNFKPGFKAWMHQKDLRIVLDEAHKMGVSLPNSAATAQMLNGAVGCGMGEDDSISLLRLLEKLSGRE